MKVKNDANTVRQEVEKRAYKAYFDDQAQTSGEIVKSMADFALAERQKVWEEAAKIAQWHADIYASCSMKRGLENIANEIRSQAATERGEGKVQR